MFMSPGSPVQGFAGHACHRDIFSEGVNNFHVFALLIPAGNCGVKKRKGSLVVEKAPGTSRRFLGSVHRAVVSSVAVAAMLGVYAINSITSYGVAALGLTGATGLALASSAQPAQAHRYRRRRRRGYRGWGWGGWGPGIYLNFGPRYRRRRRWHRGYW